MKAPSVKRVSCAIYTRVSTEHGLDQEFNSLDAQYDAASAYPLLRLVATPPWRVQIRIGGIGLTHFSCWHRRQHSQSPQ